MQSSSSLSRSSGAGSSGLGRVLVPLALALATTLGAVLSAGAPARAEAPATVTVEDTVGVVDSESLSSQLEEVDFRRAVDLHVLVLDVRDHGIDPDEDTALNDAVLAHARQEAPQLLSADEEHWSDGLVLLAIDPEGRFLGSYAGEDVKLSEGGFDSVQDDMREPAADGRWEEAFTEGARTYAALLDRPWWQHPATIGLAVVVLGLVVAAVASFLVGRRNARRRADEAQPRYDDVMAKRRLTNTTARNLPDRSPYADAARRDHDHYSAQLTEVEELHDQLPPLHRRGWGWGLKGSQRRLSRDFATTVAELDDLDDDIIATHDLLHRVGDWREAWERELQPLREAVDSLDQLLEDAEAEDADARDADAEHTEAEHTGPDAGRSGSGAGQGLRDLGTRITAEMDELTARLEADAVTPDDALERLDQLTEMLSDEVAELRDHRVALLAEDPTEEDILREADVPAHGAGEDHYRSVRRSRHAMETAASGQATFWHLNPVLWYSLWHTESSTALESHRHPEASTGGTSGYSAGGFSGAGSSSSF